MRGIFLIVAVILLVIACGAKAQTPADLQRAVTDEMQRKIGAIEMDNAALAAQLTIEHKRRVDLETWINQYFAPKETEHVDSPAKKPARK